MEISCLPSIEHKDLYNQAVKHDYCNFRDISIVKGSIRTCEEKSQQTSSLNELRFITISQPGMKSNILFCNNCLVLMTAIATKHCTHDAGFRQFSPCVFIMGDLI